MRASWRCQKGSCDKGLIKVEDVTEKVERRCRELGRRQKMPRDSKQRFPAAGIDLLADEEGALSIARWIPKSLQYKPDIRPPST
jgi:hypothetical protein